MAKTSKPKKTAETLAHEEAKRKDIGLGVLLRERLLDAAESVFDTAQSLIDSVEPLFHMLESLLDSVQSAFSQRC